MTNLKSKCRCYITLIIQALSVFYINNDTLHNKLKCSLDILVVRELATSQSNMYHNGYM